MSKQSESKKFLIVDDSSVERTLVRGLIRKHWPNCSILEAADGEEGLRAIESESPDLVLTDVCMPRSGGLDMLAALRDKKSVVPVVVMSGIGDAESAVKALHAGAASYIPKSKLPELLYPTISMVSEFAETHQNRRRVIGCLKGMELQFELDNDNSLIMPLVRYLEDHIGSLQVCDESELVRIGVALHESLTNAINHGNLELDSDLRQDDERLFYELGESRRLIWPYCDRRVQVFASLGSERVRFVIRDEGPGFNHQKIQDPTQAENLDRVGGRGLLLIHSFMDEVSYNDRGNEITLVKYTSAGRKLLVTMSESKSRSPARELVDCPA
ncbi:MAG: response regulator receiver [Planctomycetota bacterium]|nr:MAG: response regulator receiver [Planctomycetota bacterium]